MNAYVYECEAGLVRDQLCNRQSWQSQQTLEKKICGTD